MRFNRETVLGESLRNIYYIDAENWDWINQRFFSDVLKRVSYFIGDVNDIDKVKVFAHDQKAKITLINNTVSRSTNYKTSNLSRIYTPGATEFILYIPIRIPALSVVNGARLAVVANRYSWCIVNIALEFQFYQDGPWVRVNRSNDRKEIQRLLTKFATIF